MSGSHDLARRIGAQLRHGGGQQLDEIRHAVRLLTTPTRPGFLTQCVDPLYSTMCDDE